MTKALDNRYIRKGDIVYHHKTYYANGEFKTKIQKALVTNNNLGYDVTTDDEYCQSQLFFSSYVDALNHVIDKYTTQKNRICNHLKELYDLKKERTNEPL